MSRSYKKHPWWKCCPGAYTKKMANRRLRRYLNSDPNVDWPQKGNLHRKYTESWEINDYIFDGFWERFKEWNWVRESILILSKKLIIIGRSIIGASNV